MNREKLTLHVKRHGLIPTAFVFTLNALRSIRMPQTDEFNPDS